MRPSYPRIEIKETITELKFLYQMESLRPFQKRIRLLMEIKKSPKANAQALSEKTGIAWLTVRAWIKLYKKGGLQLMLMNHWDNQTYRRKRVITKKLSRIIEERLKAQPAEGYSALLKWLKEYHAPDLKYSTLSLYIRRHFPLPKIQLPLQQLQIKESIEELERIKKLHDKKAARRIRTLIYIKKYKMYRTQQISGILRVSRGTVSHWILLYKKGGLEKLMAHPQN